MADKKISALTTSGTPLAGTEVLPIVQSSATVKVSVDNLTAGRAVSATSIATGLGLVATPAHTFTGDLNTGMWSPAADTIALSTAGAERFRVTSAGDAGVGTTAPATGSLDNQAVLNAGILATLRGSVASTSGVAVTVGVANQNSINATYIVSCGISSGAPTVYSAVSIVSADNNVLRATALQTAALMSISVSSTNIQATQSSGGASTIVYSITRVS